MFKNIPTKILLIITVNIICFIYIIYNIYPIISFTLQSHKTKTQYSLFIGDDREGYISTSLYNELRSYITSRNNTIGQIPKRFRIKDINATSLPLNYDYIRSIEKSTATIHPYSTWECSNTSNTDYANAGEYCILTNIYFNSATDQYYFYQDPSKNTTSTQRDSFMTPYDELKLTIINNITLLETPVASILTRPVLVAAPPDLNYAHGFLELCGPRFWVLAECQSHASYVNPSKIQIYYTSTMFKNHLPNWELYKQKSDGTYKPQRQWEQMVQSMFSIYPLLIYSSFNNTTVMFKYMVFPGRQMSRSASWGYNYLDRKFQSYPLSTQHYRRAYLAYSEWILYHFNLTSKFQLTSSQEELQQKHLSEKVSMCNLTCENIQQQPNISTDDYTGEWIVVLNRAGSNARSITNAKFLVEALLKIFPDHSNPYLRVWPKQFNFNDNFYASVRMARSIRLLIGVHGAGLANTVFMRPGAVLYEINPYGCRHLSFNFRRWAEAFSLQHALWIPSVGEHGGQNDMCDRDGATTVNIKEIIDEVKNLLKNEREYRTGYLKRALDIMNDMSIVDYPPPGYENVLS